MFFFECVFEGCCFFGVCWTECALYFFVCLNYYHFLFSFFEKQQQSFSTLNLYVNVTDSSAITTDIIITKTLLWCQLHLQDMQENHQQLKASACLVLSMNTSWHVANAIHYHHQDIAVVSATSTRYAGKSPAIKGKCMLGIIHEYIMTCC